MNRQSHGSGDQQDRARGGLKDELRRLRASILSWRVQILGDNHYLCKMDITKSVLAIIKYTKVCENAL